MEEETLKENRFLISQEEYAEHVLRHKEKGYEYLERINACLKNKTGDSVIEFIQIFQEKELVEECISCLQELAYGYIFSIITLAEVRNLKTVQFILNGNSVQELIRVLKQIEFRIWELEFEGGKVAEQRLYDVMQRYSVTPEAMSNIIIVSAMDKCNVYMLLSCIYLEYQKVDDAIRLLRYGLEWFPEDEGLLYVLAQLYRKTGQISEAEACEEKIKFRQQ